MKTRKIIITLALTLAIFTASMTTAVAENSAPVAENFEITTFVNTSTSGQLTAIDPEGDLTTFEITTPPIKGDIELSEDGNYIYTPKEGKKGKDYFGYKATDSDGNISHEATVIIKIEKQKSQVSYSDLEGHAVEYAAVLLADEEIFVGHSVGDEYIFSPDVEVTRGEFLAMCMKLSEIELLSDVSKTGFSDDETIPQWIKPYASTALMCGAISGVSTENGVEFNASEIITSAEAAVMLNNIMNFTDVRYGQPVDTVPVWANQASMNLEAHNIISSSSVNSDSLNREDAAFLLSRAFTTIN